MYLALILPVNVSCCSSGFDESPLNFVALLLPVSDEQWKMTCMATNSVQIGGGRRCDSCDCARARACCLRRDVHFPILVAAAVGTSCPQITKSGGM